MSVWLGKLGYYASRALCSTLRFSVEHHPEYNPEQQALFAFWHGKQFLPVIQLAFHRTPTAALVSASKDGDILAVWLNHLGYEVVRGSSRRQNVAALVGMIRKLKQGYSLGFGVDGPTGPIYQAKPGIVHMAKKLEIPIIPVGSAYSRCWVVEKAWDKYQIPKPFAKAAFYLGKPICVLAEDNLELGVNSLERAIEQAEQRAIELL